MSFPKQNRLRRPAASWAALLVGAIGSLGGIAMSAWFLVASSHGGGGDPVVNFSQVELKAYSITMLVLFCIALAATTLSLKAPRAAGLALIVSAGLSMILAVFGTLMWLGGGLLLMPCGFLAVVAGAILITRVRPDTATP